MNREIKFRAKDAESRNWVYGSLFKNEICTRIIKESAIIDDDGVLDEYSTVLPETVGQFTGLKDKNENDIYEGDILKCYDFSALDEEWNLEKIHTGVIVFTSPQYSLKVPGKLIYRSSSANVWENDVYLNYWNNAENLEIIGNIHDNPELLNAS